MSYLKYILAIFLLGASTLFAADVQMSVEPALISLLDRAVLKVEFIDTTGDVVAIPPVEGLRIQYQGQSSETRMVNWQTTKKIVHTYIITPSKIGEYTIGPVDCKYKGGSKKVSTKLKVIKPADDKEAQQISEMLFSTISSKRNNPYVHEPFQLDVYVHVRDGVQTDGQFGVRGGMPENGLDGEPSWELLDQQRQEINGAIFTIYHLRATVKTLTAGTFSFQPQMQLNIVVPRQRRRGYGQIDPFFGDFFGRQETRPIVLDCNQLDIEVQPIPTANRPASYTGGIGVFDFDVEVGPKAVKMGEPITVKMRVHGEGNLKQITPPKIETHGNLKFYEAHTLEAEAPNEVRFEQVVIPKSGEVKEIPPISFTYFNTQTSDFRTVTKGPFPVNVEATPVDQTAKVIATIPASMTPKETKILGRDIVYLKSRPARWKTGENHRSDQWLYPVIAIPALLVLVTAGFSIRRDSLAGNIAKARRQKAPKSARQHIQCAEQAIREENASAFYEAVWNALADYFGNRLNLAPGDITLSIVLRHLPADRKNEAAALEKLFGQIDHRRYGSSGNDSRDEMKATLNSTNEMLKQCERMKL